MADLEDFFAKRDKKKKKAPKFEADSVAKILEKKRVDMGKSSYQPSSESTEPISEYKVTLASLFIQFHIHDDALLQGVLL